MDWEAVDVSSSSPNGLFPQKISLSMQARNCRGQGRGQLGQLGGQDPLKQFLQPSKGL